MNLIWNVESKRNKIIFTAAAVKIIFTVELQHSNSLYNDASGILTLLGLGGGADSVPLSNFFRHLLNY